MTSSETTRRRPTSWNLYSKVVFFPQIKLVEDTAPLSGMVSYADTKSKIKEKYNCVMKKTMSQDFINRIHNTHGRYEALQPNKPPSAVKSENIYTGVSRSSIIINYAHDSKNQVRFFCQTRTITFLRKESRLAMKKVSWLHSIPTFLSSEKPIHASWRPNPTMRPKKLSPKKVTDIFSVASTQSQKKIRIVWTPPWPSRAHRQNCLQKFQTIIWPRPGQPLRGGLEDYIVRFFGKRLLLFLAEWNFGLEFAESCNFSRIAQFSLQI